MRNRIVRRNQGRFFRVFRAMHQSLFEAYSYRATVAVELLNFAELRNDRDRFAERLPIVADDARSPLELINGESAERLARTACWKLMARAGEKITRGNWCKPADENCAGVQDRFGHLFAVPGDKRNVIGRERTCDCNGLLFVFRENEERVLLEELTQGCP